MNASARTLALATLAALAAAGPAAGQGSCTSERLAVKGTPVAVAYCVRGPVAAVPGGEVAVPVDASYSAPSGVSSQHLVLHFVASDGPSRVLQNLDLTKIGMDGTLHLTLVYAGGVVRVDAAMLTPGAITIK